MMAKSLHSTKNKKSNSFKPYDISNSLVRRVTSRVSQLLPQPTTWLNRFLSPRPNSEISHVESQEDDEEFFQPPSKRIRHVHTSTDLARQSTSAVDREAIATIREEEISPIRSVGTSTGQDFAVAGPSGLGRKDLFVSSTPATYEHPVAPKVNGDDFSDSESASCCSSSLPPPIQDVEHSSLLRTLNVSKQNVPSIPTSSVRGRTPLYRSKERKLDLSASSFPARGRISFDRTVFNSPFKGRLGTSSLSTSLLSSSRDESTFYSGPTMYGGASGSSDSILRTRILHSEVPEIVKPSEPVRPSSSNLASSTAKILKALEQFSTPVIEAKKMPIREGGLKRKAPAPYRELLVIPQMPDLLRIKRRDARRMERRPSSDATTAASKAASCSSSMATTVQQSTTQELDQRLKKDEDSTKEVGETSGKRIPTPEPNKIPSLSFSSLPKFDPGIVKPITHSPKPLQTPDPPSKPKETSIGPTTSTYFKFSKPINVSENLSSIAPIPLTKKFSTPLEPEISKPVCKFGSDSNKKSLSNCVSDVGPEKMTYTPPSHVTLKRKQPSAETKNETLNEIKSIASSTLSKNLSSTFNSSRQKWECSQCYVSNDSDKKVCVACDSPKVTLPKETKVGFGDKFKPNPQEWECSTCLVRNKNSSSKCVACGYSKDGDKGKKVVTSGDKFKPPVSVEIKQFLSNKVSDSMHAASGGRKEGIEASCGQPLSSVFKKPEGSWECDTCLIQNKSDVNECVACNSRRPGFKEDKQQTFSFGVLGKKVEDKPAAAFSFGVPSTTLSNSVPSERFKFGAPSSQINESTSENLKFTFGVPPKSANEEKSSDTITKPNSLFSNSVKGNIFGNNSSNAPLLKSSNISSEEKTVAGANEKPLFSFGNASKDSSNNFGTVTSTFSASTSIPQTTSAGKSEIPANSVAVSSTNDAKPISSVPNPIFSFGSASTPLSGLNKENCVSQESNKPVESSPLFNSTPGSVFNDIKPSIDVSLTKSKTFNFFNKNDNLFPKSDNKQVAFPFGSNGGVETKTLTFPNQEQKQEGGFAFNINKSESQNATSMSHSDQPKPFLSGSFNNTTFGGSFAGPKSISEKQSEQFNSHPTSTGGFTLKPQDNQGAQSFSFATKDPLNQQSSNPISFGANTNHTNSFTPSGQLGTGMSDGFASNQPSSTFGSSNSGFNFVQIQPIQSTAYTFGAANDRPSFPSQGSGAANNVGTSGGFSFSQPQNSTTPQTPSFDPSVKPVYKFSAGPTPTFSATAVGNEPLNAKPPRIIRKAVRRTTQK